LLSPVDSTSYNSTTILQSSRLDLAFEITFGFNFSRLGEVLVLGSFE